MNLELPFPEQDASIDEHVAAMDEGLEPLFLEAVSAELARLRAARAASAGDDETAAA